MVGGIDLGRGRDGVRRLKQRAGVDMPRIRPGQVDDPSRRAADDDQ